MEGANSLPIDVNLAQPRFQTFVQFFSEKVRREVYRWGRNSWIGTRERMALDNFRRNLTRESFRMDIVGLTSRDSERIGVAVDDYSMRLAMQTIQRLARTSTRAAWFGGQVHYLRGLVETGRVPLENIRLFWETQEDARSEHGKIATLNKDGVDVFSPFQSPLGPIHFPCDPMAAPGNTENCRCSIRAVIKLT